MEIKLCQGTKCHVQDCKEALMRSDLGKVYFSNEDKAIRAIDEFVQTGKLLVALNEEDTVLGFIGYIQNGAFHSFPYLHIIAIREEYRGKGVGGKMMKCFEDMMFNQSSKVFLVVADFNPKAKLFYEKLGYQEVGSIPDLYKEGVTEFLMMKVKSE